MGFDGQIELDGLRLYGLSKVARASVDDRNPRNSTEASTLPTDL